jgi:plasmid replication initiation protein
MQKGNFGGYCMKSLKEMSLLERKVLADRWSRLFDAYESGGREAMLKEARKMLGIPENPKPTESSQKPSRS